MKHSLLLTVTAAFFLAGSARAQPALLLTSQHPTRNAIAIPHASSLNLTFSQAPSSSPASLNGLRLFGSQRGGRLAGTATVSGNVLTFDPARNLVPGEKVDLTLTTALQGSGGQGLSRGYVSQFTVGATGGTGTFSGGSNLAVGPGPSKVLAGDLNGDGNLDLVTVENTGTSAGVIALRLGDGHGAFGSSSTIPVALPPTGLVLADLDADGDLDLAWTVSSNSQVGVRLNNGTGQFPTGSSVQVPDFPGGLAVGDVDGDGDLDLLAACANGTGTVNLCLNNGSGTFTRRNPAIAVGGFNSGPADLTLGDVDNDGDLDLATANAYNGTASVLLNAGNGTFSSHFTGAVGMAPLRPRRVLMGDVNGDHSLDLLTVSSEFGAGSITVQLNDGAGNFPLKYETAVSSTPFDFTLADVDGDDDLDLLTINNLNTGLASVWVNDGSGAFTAAGSTVALPALPKSIMAADVDRDGDIDLLTTNSGAVSVRLNGGTSAPLAAKPRAVQGALQLFPNPAHAAVRLTIPAGSGPQLQVLNDLGQVVRTQSLPSGAAELLLPLVGLRPGSYVLRVGSRAQRLLVE